MTADVTVGSSGIGPTFTKRAVPRESVVRIMEYLTVGVLLQVPRDGVAIIIRRAE